MVYLVIDLLATTGVSLRSLSYWTESMEGPAHSAASSGRIKDGMNSHPSLPFSTNPDCLRLSLLSYFLIT